MDKREFIQRYMIENHNRGDNIHHDIDYAVTIYNTIEESFVKTVQSSDLWVKREP